MIPYVANSHRGSEDKMTIEQWEALPPPLVAGVEG